MLTLVLKYSKVIDTESTETNLDRFQVLTIRFLCRLTPPLQRVENPVNICINLFYPRDAMLARVFAIATYVSVCLSVCPSHAGIVPSRAKAGS